MDAEKRGKGKTATGIVVAAGKMRKTITVERERLVKHPRYYKYLKRRKRFLVHDEHEKAGLGDLVRIIESRPFSKRKHWRLLEVVERGKVDFEPVPEAPDADVATLKGGKA